MIFLTVFSLLLNLKHCYDFALSQLQFHTPSEVKMSWSVQCLNLTLMIEAPMICLSHPIQLYLQPRASTLKGQGLFCLPTCTMLIPTSVPLFFWLLKPGMHSSPSWPLIWAIFQELLYEAFPQCPNPQLSHFSLEFTLPLACTISLSTESTITGSECCTHIVTHFKSSA